MSDNKPCKAILIDPVARTVEWVDYSGDFRDISKLLGCDLFDRFRVAGIKGNDAIFVDDEGLFKTPNPLGYFAVNGYPQVLSGRGLVMGCDEKGDTITPTEITPENLRNNIRWCELDESGAMKLLEDNKPQVISFDSPEAMLEHLYGPRPSVDSE